MTEDNLDYENEQIPTSLKVLIMISQHQNRHKHEISERANISKSHMLYHLKNLIRQGLIIVDDSDYVHLTSDGKVFVNLLIGYEKLAWQTSSALAFVMAFIGIASLFLPAFLTELTQVVFMSGSFFFGSFSVILYALWRNKIKLFILQRDIL